jgi:hypothetical protein
VFGPNTNWTIELPTHAMTTNKSNSPVSPLDHDAEIAHLPPGLLDSPTLLSDAENDHVASEAIRSYAPQFLPPPWWYCPLHRTQTMKSMAPR